mgnify:CR=1 FL=1
MKSTDIPLPIITIFRHEKFNAYRRMSLRATKKESASSIDMSCTKLDGESIAKSREDTWVASFYLLLEGSQSEPGVIRFGLGDILNVHSNVADHPVFERCETGRCHLENNLGLTKYDLPAGLALQL